MKIQKKRKGSTIVEIIIVLVIIAILLVLGFAGGKKVIDQAKITTAQSDLRTMEFAIKQMLLEHPEYITKKSTDTGFLANRVSELNRYFPDTYKLSGTTNVYTANTDPWTKNYRVVFAADDTLSNFFKVYVVCGGTNAKMNAAESKIEKDDLILVVKLQDGDVRSAYFGFNADNEEGNVITDLEP